MSDEQKRDVNFEDRTRASSEESAGKKGEPRNSYYYDDATGYEIYQDETDDRDAEEPEEEV